MNARAIKHGKSGVAFGEYGRQIGAGDQYRFSTIAGDKRARQFTQFLRLRIRAATFDKILVDVLDAVDFARLRHDRFDAIERAEHARLDGEAGAEQRDPFQPARVHSVTHFGQHIDQRQRGDRFKLRSADVRRCRNDGSELSAARGHAFGQSGEIACEAFKILCGDGSVNTMNVGMGNEQARHAAPSFVAGDQLTIIMNCSAGSEPTDQPETPSWLGCVAHDGRGSHVSGMLPT